MRERGFTLVELAVMLVVLTVLLSGLAIPLAAQVQARREGETRRLLEEAKEAILGFAAAHGRLPCPALPGAGGAESFAGGGNESNGLCADLRSGLLPGATLGLAPLDSEGFVRDAWQTPRNRIRYAVFGGTAINGIDNALTRANGMQSATLTGIGAASHYLFICTTGRAASAAGCGPAANQLTRRAAFVLLSPGANATSVPPAGSDEARNLDGDGVFVYHEASNVPGREFDDIILWVPIHLVVNRLLTAGRLP